MGIKEAAPNPFGCPAVIIAIAMSVIIAFGIVPSVRDMLKEGQKVNKMSLKHTNQETTYRYALRIARCVPTISLTAGEKKELKEALVAYATDNRVPLEKWVRGLQEKGKKGVLPQLPYEFIGRDMIYLERRHILLPPEPKPTEERK